MHGIHSNSWCIHRWTVCKRASVSHCFTPSIRFRRNTSSVDSLHTHFQFPPTKNFPVPAATHVEVRLLRRATRRDALVFLSGETCVPAIHASVLHFRSAFQRGFHPLCENGYRKRRSSIVQTHLCARICLSKRHRHRHVHVKLSPQEIQMDAILHHSRPRPSSATLGRLEEIRSHLHRRFGRGMWQRTARMGARWHPMFLES